MSREFKVVLVAPYPYPDPLKRILEDIAEVKVNPLQQQELEEEMKKGDYDVLICWEFSQRITRDMIYSANPKLKIIATLSVGYDHIDVRAAKERGIKVINAAVGNICASAYSVAEFAFWLLLSSVRKTRRVFDIFERDSHSWSEFSQGIVLGEELFGKTLGIIGMGRIGSHVARIGRGFSMRVIGYDPYVNPERVLADGVILVNSLEELLSSSHVISINCYLSDETKRMIGKREISLMRNGVYIVNTARGEIVDEDAILEGLQSDKIAGYAADVLTGEPPTEKTSPLLAAYRRRELSNLLLTPHIAWMSKEAVTKRYPVIVGKKIKAALLRKTLEEWELLKE